MLDPTEFQDMANELINETFGDFRGDIIFSELGTFDYDTQTTPTVDKPAKGIRVEFDKNEIDGQKIQQGDYKILVEQQSTTVDVRSDNVSMQFKQYPTKSIPNPVFKSLSIESIGEDAAQAVYTLQVREL